MKTKVLFRMLDHEVVALFPAEAATVGNPQHCLCYAHIGQHSAADIGIIGRSRPATPEEYAPLAEELRRIGYTLDIRQRTTRNDYHARQTQLQRP